MVDLEVVVSSCHAVWRLGRVHECSRLPKSANTRDLVLRNQIRSSFRAHGGPKLACSQNTLRIVTVMMANVTKHRVHFFSGILHQAFYFIMNISSLSLHRTAVSDSI